MKTIRHFMNLVESAGRESVSAFAEHMVDACTQAGVGFYFEEGGCWGMALALYDHFTSAGAKAQLMIGTTHGRDSHAMVEFSGRFYDHQGVTQWTGTVDHVSRAELMARAEVSGVGEDQIDADLAQAAEIIERAIEMVGQGVMESAGRKSVTEVARPSVLYHATTIEGLYEILGANVIDAKTGHRIDHPSARDWALRQKDADARGYVSGVSLTRSLAFARRWSGRKVPWKSEPLQGAVLALDGDAIRRDFRLIPIAFWTGRDSRWISDEARAKSDEAEEFVVGAIKSLNRYLMHVEVTQNVLDADPLIASLPDLFNITLTVRNSNEAS